MVIEEHELSVSFTVAKCNWRFFHKFHSKFSFCELLFHRKSNSLLFEVLEAAIQTDDVGQANELWLATNELTSSLLDVSIHFVDSFHRLVFI